jgi:hypothetical protein
VWGVGDLELSGPLRSKSPSAQGGGLANLQTWNPVAL